jgi:hypothetical protein
MLFDVGFADQPAASGSRSGVAMPDGVRAG